MNKKVDSCYSCPACSFDSYAALYTWMSIWYKKGLLMSNPPCDLKDPNNPYSQPTAAEPYPQFPQQIPPPSLSNQELPSFPSSPGQSSQNVPNFPQSSGQYIQNVYFGQFNQPPPPQLPISKRRQFGPSLGLQSPNLWQRLCHRVWKREVFALKWRKWRNGYAPNIDRIVV